MRIFITGACKNGKSTYAEQIASSLKLKEHPLYYLATMYPKDHEDLERIDHHREQRKEYGFETIEIATNIHECLNTCDVNGTFLLDSITALLENEMFKQDGSVEKYAYEKVIGDLRDLLRNIKSIVMVSDYIFSDAEVYEMLTEEYRMGLGKIHREIVKLCDVVIEVSYGSLIFHKGQKEFKAFYEEVV